MLQFFRKYQKFFFLFVTIIIVTTFVFFGTYQAFAPGHSGGNEEVFQDLNGKKIRKHYFSHLCHFLQDEEETYGLGNFLNDGIISKDLLETKRALSIYKKDPAAFSEDLASRHKKEVTYRPFAHSQSPLISAENAWNLFAPDVNLNLKKLQGMAEGNTYDAFETKVALYLAEKKFPGALLAHILRYQENEQKGLAQDYKLASGNLSLFGYHDLQDWFGPKFIETAAKIIVNGAAEARIAGIKVERAEVVADLALKSSRVFQAKRNEMPAHIQSGSALLSGYMQGRGIDEETLVDIWQDVLLYRRLFQEIGSTLPLDTMAMKDFYSYANEKVTLDVSQMPKCFRFENVSEMKKFEHYLQLTAVAKKSPLDLPLEALPIAEIAKKEPKLIKSRFVVESVEVSKKELGSKVTMRNMWEWEAQNAQKLVEKFPDLKGKSLDDLDLKERAQIDSYARAQIVAEHPEWIETALKEKAKEEKEIVLLHDDKALKEKLQTGSVEKYTKDNETYLSMSVKEAKGDEVMSFEEALSQGFLKEVACDDVVAALSEKLKAEKKIGSDVHAEKIGDVVAPWRFVSYLPTSSTHSTQDTEFAKQFAPMKKEETISRGASGLVSLTEVQTLPEKSVSSPQLNKKEGLFIYTVVSKTTDTTLPLEKMLEAQKALADEMGNHFFEEKLAAWICSKAS